MEEKPDPFADLSPEALAAITEAVKRLAYATHCIHCGTEVEQFVQQGRCYYAEPCGCRQGQGQAKGMNARRLQNKK